MVNDPFKYVKENVARSISEYINYRYGVKCGTDIVESFIEIPPKEEFGDLALPVPRIIKSCSINAGLDDLVRGIIEALGKLEFVRDVSRANVYVNVRLDEVVYGRLVAESLRGLSSNYGLPRVGRTQRIVVEFVSANPIHPLHIGSGRNAALGSFISNILKFVGHEVERRYYIDDLGLQVAQLAYGYKLLGRPKPPRGMKEDHFMGIIYAATSTLLEIRRLRSEAYRAQNEGRYEDYSRIMAEISRLVADLQYLKDKGREVSDLIDTLIDRMNEVKNPEGEVSELMRKYEEGDEDVVKLVREVVELTMKGIRKTLELLGIEIDVWDWESDLVREGLVRKVIEEARSKPNFTLHKGAPALDFKDLLSSDELRRKLRIPKGLEVPPLILARSDGTTLYTTRDIAYTIKKFREFNADKVINVIAIEQTLPQAQLRLALYSLGYRKEAENTIHYAYEMVNLPGISMSSRRGRYVTVDEVIENLKSKVINIMRERGSEVSNDAALRIARSAFKYLMLSTSPNKVLVFDPERALDISSNSGPYLQYTYARARSVLERYGKPINWDGIDFNSFKHPIRRKLMMLIGRFPSVVSYVAEELHPEDLTTFINQVADTFNSWYDKESIIGERDEGIRNAKLALTYGVMVVLENGMRILGLDVLPRV